MSDHTQEYDVIVVGGRVAGAATAMLLARRGHRVLVVDQEQPGRDTLSTHALMRPGVLQLQRWGLLEDVIAAGTPPVSTVTFRYADDPIVVDVEHPLYAPRRTVLDPIVVAGARRAGAEFRYGVRVERVLRDQDGRVSGVAGRGPLGERFTARGRVTVGADGSRSLVARAVHAPVTRTAPSASAVIYGYWSGVDASGYEWCFDVERSAGVMPTNDGLTCVWVSAPAAHMRPLMRGDREQSVSALLEQTSPDLARRVRAGRREGVLRGAMNTVPNLTRRPWGAGWALVGDAGQHTDPLTALGISNALRDAELLADGLHASLRDPRDEAAALAAYERARDERSEDLFAVSTVISSLRWDLAEAQRQHLILSRALQRDARAIMALDGELTGVAV